VESNDKAPVDLQVFHMMTDEHTVNQTKEAVNTISDLVQ